MKNNVKENLIKKGVKLINESSIFIGDDVEIDEDVTIYPNVSIFNHVKIKKGTIIQPCTTIFSNVVINNDCLIGSNTIVRENVSIGKNTIIGPHCEVVRSNVGTSCVIGHKNYLGDAIVCDYVTFGCGAIIANTDFKNRYKTIIDEHAKIGVNVSLIAPLKIGKNAFIAAGSTITEDIPDNYFAISRVKQINKPLKNN